MKTLIIIFIFLILGLSLFSCLDGGKRSFEIYQFINNSGDQVIIHVYFEDKISYEVMIPNNDNWESEKLDITQGGARSGDGVFIPDFGEPDSILVNFGTRKQKVFYDPSVQSRHILLFPGNYDTKVKDQTTYFIYTFTNEDYENAEQIDE